MLQRDPSNGPGRVRQVYWLMDAGRLMEADAALAGLKADPAVRADAGLHLEVQRVRLALADVKEDWREALAASEAIVRIAPDDVEAQRRRVWLIADHGGAVTAAETAAASTLFDATEHAHLQQQAAGQKLSWGIATRGVRPAPQRYDGIDASLEDIDHQLEALDSADVDIAPEERDVLRSRLWADKLVGLVARARYEDAARLYESLHRDGRVIPAYGLSAAAGAHQQLRRSDWAVSLYEQALSEAGDEIPMPSDTHVGLVYAYIDTGRFEQADRLLSALEAVTPPLIRQSPEPGRPNPEFGEIRNLRALIDVYSDRPRDAAARGLTLSQLAPFSASIRSSEARIAQLREHPEAAIARHEQTLTDHPEDLGARTGYAVALMDAGRLREGGALARQMARDYPDFAPARYADRVWRAVAAPRLRMDASFGRGDGTLANREWQVLTRIEAPLLRGRWKPFVEHYRGRAETDAGNHLRHRTGVGTVWRDDRWETEIQAHQANEGPRHGGIAASVGYRAGDAWRLSASVDSNSNDVPWKAFVADINAAAYQLGAGYVVDESRRFDGQLQMLDYTDGNRRDGVAVSWTERWHSAPRTRIETTLGSDWSRNERSDVAYFAPESEASVWLRSGFQLLSWKLDDRVFLQRLEVTGGQYFQRDYGSAPLWSLSYEHQWTVGRDWLLRYGIGTGQHAYDGEQERRRFGFASVVIPFR